MGVFEIQQPCDLIAGNGLPREIGIKGYKIIGDRLIRHTAIARMFTLFQNQAGTNPVSDQVHRLNRAISSKEVGLLGTF
jgi:hypothetical protein